MLNPAGVCKACRDASGQIHRRTLLQVAAAPVPRDTLEDDTSLQSDRQPSTRQLGEEGQKKREAQNSGTPVPQGSLDVDQPGSGVADQTKARAPDFDSHACADHFAFTLAEAFLGS